MTLLDTNVLIYASEPDSLHHRWAVDTIAEAVATDGAAIDAVCLAEVCVGENRPEGVAERIRSWGVAIVDIPAAAAVVCGAAFREYRRRRLEQSQLTIAAMPLPDFFIGAHAQVMEWALATADPARFRTYFAKVRLVTPGE